MNLEVLIADDSPIARAVLEKALRLSRLPLGVLHQAADGAAALEVLARTRVDLVFLDLRMPEPDGFEVLRRMRAAPATADTPVIVLSADVEPARLPQLNALGVAARLRKPFRPELLRRIVQSVLGEDHV